MASGGPETVTITYLEMDDPAALVPSRPLDPAASLVACRATVGFYRYLLATVGGPWSWTDRIAWTDEEVAAHLARAEVELHLLLVDGCPAGFAEFRREEEAAEIVYFGLAPEFLGRGLGGPFLVAVLREAWSRPIRRVRLNTCTLDAPEALPNYLARGFRVVGRAERPA